MRCRRLIACLKLPKRADPRVYFQLIDEVFFQLMAISASWESGTERTEFAVEFNDQVGRLLNEVARSLRLLQDQRVDGSRLAKDDEQCVCRVAEEAGKAGKSAEETKEELLIAHAKRTGQVLENLYAKQLPKVSAYLCL